MSNEEEQEIPKDENNDINFEINNDKDIEEKKDNLEKHPEDNEKDNKNLEEKNNEEKKDEIEENKNEDEEKKDGVEEKKNEEEEKKNDDEEKIENDKNEEEKIEEDKKEGDKKKENEEEEEEKLVKKKDEKKVKKTKEDNMEKNNIEKDDNNRESVIKLERVTENTLDKIEEGEDSKKVSSFQTILSIWNTMIGSSMVAIPYNVYRAGILPTVFIGLLYGFICYFTCSIVVKLGGKEEEFANIVYKYFNYVFGKRIAKIGKITQLAFNLLINIGATFIYFLIINQNLYPCICLVLNAMGLDIDGEDLTPTFTRFSFLYCALIVSIAVFPLTIMKEMGCLVKFNSFGIYFVSVLIVYVIYIGISTMATNSFSFEYKANVEGSEERYLHLFGEESGILCGTLSLGYFSHSVILPLIKNNRKQENNQRDLFLGYCCVTATYIFIGILGYVGFSGSDFSPEFKMNWFQFYKSDNYFIFALRLLNVVQLSSIFPILTFVIRRQFFSIACSRYLNSTFHIVLFNVFLIILCIIVLSLTYDNLGELIGYIGATTALVLVYSIAPITNMIYYYIRHKPRNKSIQDDDKEDEVLYEEPKTEFLLAESKDSIPLKPIKAFLFYFSMNCIIAIGIMTVILQFWHVNFFDVHIQNN
jgi:sodium-coupled neutral amino acid transporter 9